MSRLWTLLALTAMMVVGTVAAHAGNVLIINGRAMVPLKSFGEYFGASISYNSQHGISVGLDYQNARLYPGSRRAYIGNREILLDSNVIILSGVTYVPVNFIDNFGYNSRWDDRAREVIIVQPRTQKRVVMACNHDKPGPRYSTRRPWISEHAREKNGRSEARPRNERKERYDRKDCDHKNDCDHKGHGKGPQKSHGKGHRK